MSPLVESPAVAGAAAAREPLIARAGVALDYV
jgi:hypothetical protein